MMNEDHSSLVIHAFPQVVIQPLELAPVPTLASLPGQGQTAARL
jgi:hypothetical protein